MSEDEKSNSDSQSSLACKETNAAIQEKIRSGCYKLQERNGRSEVWSVFSKIEDNNGLIIPDKVCCGHCFTVLTYNKRTSTKNLSRHKCFTKNVDSDIGETLPTAAKTQKRKLISKTETSSSNKKSVDNNFVQDRNQIRHNILTGVFKLRTKISKCKVWHIFKLIEDTEGIKIPNRVCCKMCFQVLNFHEHTSSNLVKHKCYVRAKHTIFLKKNFKNNSMEIESSSQSLENVNTKGNECLEVASYTEMDEFGPIKEWVESYTIHELEETTSSPNEDAKSKLKAEAEKIFSEWCMENFRPYNIVKDSGLRRFAEFMVWIGANYGTSVDTDDLLPETTSIAESITSQYRETFNNIKNEIVEHCKNGYGLTSKIWTDNYSQQSFMSLTIHYTKNGQLVTKFLDLSPVRDENMCNIIEVKVQETLNNYDCYCTDSAIVTDGILNMFSVWNTFTHISCINHILDNVINAAINEVEELEKLYRQCVKIKKYFTQSKINYNLSATFDSLCSTKWNASYYLLQAIGRNCQEIEQILQENDELLECKDINKHFIEQVLNILKPFEHVSKKLECKEHPTIHLVYACINGLKDSCSAEENDEDTIRKFKEILSTQLQTTVISQLSITHKIALFLFPPANKLLQFSEDEKSFIKAKISFLLAPYVKNENKPMKKEPTAKANTMVTSYLKNFVAPPTNINSSDQISNEIRSYECLNIPFEDNFDILQWWHLRQSQFPLLYILSCKILAIPATCASSNLVFSMVRQMAESNTNILSNPETLNQLIFLNLNSEKSRKFEELYSEEIRIVNSVIEEI